VNRPLISVVIPSYNHAHFLPRALKSIQCQSWKNWEVLVVDNHSSDNTDEVLQPWVGEQIRLLKIHNNGVIAASRNIGVCNARGEWIAFLDSDDWWTADKLEVCVQHADASGADLVYHDLTMVDSNGRARAWRRSRSRQVATPAYEDLVRNGCAVPNSSVVVKKALIDSIGGLCEERELIGWEDFDTWLRLARQGCRFSRVPGSHGFYWVGGGSVSNPKRTLANIDAFLQRHLGDACEADIPWWCHYSRAVAYSNLGETDKVGPAFSAAWRARPDLINRLRIACKWVVTR
jgi:glycosyltransferase involved in cell wall biosynthesis